MAVPEQRSPTCEISGLPLPLLMVDSSPGAEFSSTNYHHHFHPDRSDELQGISGRALRYSRGQTVSKALHARYHRIYGGPELPSTQKDTFVLSVLACAGVVPRTAIDVTRSGDAHIISLSDAERQKIIQAIDIESGSHPKISIKTRRSIGIFFAQYALSRGVHTQMSDKVIGEFLDPLVSRNRKKELGNFILKETISDAAHDVSGVHDSVVQAGLIPPNRIRSPGKIVRSFFTIERFEDYHVEIERVLAA